MRRNQRQQVLAPAKRFKKTDEERKNKEVAREAPQGFDTTLVPLQLPTDQDSKAVVPDRASSV